VQPVSSQGCFTTNSRFAVIIAKLPISVISKSSIGSIISIPVLLYVEKVGKEKTDGNHPVLIPKLEVLESVWNKTHVGKGK